MRKIAPVIAGFAAAALLMTGCSAQNSGGNAGGATLTVGMPNGTQTNNQSPFATGSSALSLGYAFVIYEPLMMVNEAKPADDAKPWLADSIKWNDDYTSAVITPHADIKWSDGKDMTAEDIAYSIQMRIDNEALNDTALPYDKVESDGKTVTVSFTDPQYVNRSKVADILIVPKHIWKDVKDPAKDVNKNPVGTGPYTLKSWTPQAATLVANENYWGGKPQVPTIRYSSYNDNNALTTALTTGEAQWGWTFIADYKNVYIAKDPDHNNQYAASNLGIDALFLNNETAPFDNKALRQALNMVVDRQQAVDVATSGVNPALKNVTGLPTPAGDSFVSDEFSGKDFKVDPTAAKKVLTDAGYTYNGDKLVDPQGQPVTFTLTNPAGWNDYLTALDLIKTAAATIGVEATVQPANQDAWFTDVPLGNFQATLHWTDGGSTPWNMYSDTMDGAQYQPNGTAANWNFGRFQNDEATQALATYASTSDDAERETAMATIQKVFVNEVPAIPLWSRPLTAQYSTKNYVGWPSEKDPYAGPQPTRRGAADIVMHLKPAGK